MQNKNYFGYYSVGDKTTQSKLEAIELYGHNSSEQIKWHFNEDVFGAIDWSKEPEGSLDFWYAQRAQQIREKYDYLILWYSGGADSHNVLMSFVKNNIFIDEIVQFHNMNGENGNKNSSLNSEVFYTSAPNTEKLINENPIYKNTKHRLIDVTDFQINLFKENNIKWDYWYLFPNFSPNTFMFSILPSLVKDWKNIVDHGKTVCSVVGVDKPIVKADQKGVMWAEFNDSLFAPPLNLTGNVYWFHEFFYWTPDMPQLPIKQAHCVKNYLEHLSDKDADNYHVYKGKFEYDKFGRPWPDVQVQTSIKHGYDQYHLLHHGLHRLIYSEWDTKTIVCPKSPSRIFSLRDQWYLNDSAPEVGQRFYIKELLSVRQKIKKIDPKLWWEFEYVPGLNFYNGGIVPFTNRYKLN